MIDPHLHGDKVVAHSKKEVGTEKVKNKERVTMHEHAENLKTVIQFC